MLGHTSTGTSSNKKKVHTNMSVNEWFLSLIKRLHSIMNNLTKAKW